MVLALAMPAAPVTRSEKGARPRTLYKGFQLCSRICIGGLKREALLPLWMPGGASGT